MHGKVVITQPDAWCWFDAPVYAKWLPLTEEDFKNSFSSLKTNKNPCYDNTHVNIIRNFYNELKHPLMNILNLPLNTGIFPDRMKISKVTPVSKKVKM